MRMSLVSLLTTGMLVFSAASASAYRVTATTSYDGRDVAVSDSITLDIWLDTEGQSEILSLQIFVTFDNTQLTYVTNGPNPNPYNPPPGTSDADNYPLYAPAWGTTPSTWLAPQVPNGGSSYDAPDLVRPDQVGVYQLAAALAPTVAVSANEHLATLVFVVANPTHTSALSLSGRLNALCTICPPEGDPISFGPDVSVNVAPVPEPGANLLAVLGLLMLAMWRRRSDYGGRRLHSSPRT